MPDPHRRIVRVWIEEGCLICNSCATVAPAVFTVNDQTASLRENAIRWFDSQRDAIEQAQDWCCVDVIRIAYASGEGAGLNL